MALHRSHLINLALDVYKPPDLSKGFISERNRTIFSEKFKEPNATIPRLSQLCVQTLAESSQIHHPLKGNDAIQFGELLSEDLSLFKMLQIDNDTFWEKVIQTKVPRHFYFFIKLQENFSWRNIVMESKCAKIAGSKPYEDWNDDEIALLSKLVSPYIFKLEIIKFHPSNENTSDRSPYLSIYPVYKLQDSQHANLRFMGNLLNLTSLSLELAPPTLGINYDCKFFNFSDSDIQNLSEGLTNLLFLKRIRIFRSRLNAKKLKTLVIGLRNCPLEFVQISFCRLGDDCGLSLGKLLETNISITSLELEGNSLSIQSMAALAYSIQNYKGKLNYLGLARNPLTDEGVEILGRGLYKSQPQQVSHINVAGINITETGAKLFLKLISLYRYFRKINISDFPLGISGGMKLIQYLESHFMIISLECSNCDISVEQEIKIRILIQRNNYFTNNPIYMKELLSTIK